MSLIMMLIGVLAAFCIGTEKPEHVNYSLAIITAVSFLAAALIEIFSKS